MRFVGRNLISISLILAIHLPIWGKTVLKADPLLSGKFILNTSTNSLSVDASDGIELTGSYAVEMAMHLPKVLDHKQTLVVVLGYTAPYTHEFEGDRNGDFLDPRLSYGVVAGDFGVFKNLTLGVSGLIPANKETTITSMRGSLGPFVSYAFDLGKVSIGQRWSYRHAWYDYDTEPNGKMNFPEVLSLKNTLDWDITKAWSFGILAVFSYSIDYNNVDKTGTEIGFDVGYKIAKNFSASLGVLTRSGTLAPSGDYHRINIYDPSRAIGNLDLIYTF